MLTRRKFLKYSAALAAGLAFPIKWAFDPPRTYAFYQTGSLQKFAQPLRGVGPGAIPVAVTDGTTGVGGALHYTIDVNQYQDKLHPDLGNTTLWGYNPRNALGVIGVPTQKHLGGIIVAQKGTPIQITFNNNLPNGINDRHILPVDTSPFFSEAVTKYGGNSYNALTTHLHGGYVPWISDGGPETWFTPGGQYGPSIDNASGTNYYKLLNPSLQPGQGEYYYPNQQSARLMWYHDHAHDITRLNAYAGVASAYIIRDAFEASLKSQGLPDFIENGGNEIPLVIQDKIFVGSDIATKDPTWPSYCPQTPGSLWYPHKYEQVAGVYTPGKPARSLLHSRNVWRHHACEWSGLPSSDCRGTALSHSIIECLPSAISQFTTLSGRWECGWNNTQLEYLNAAKCKGPQFFGDRH